MNRDHIRVRDCMHAGIVSCGPDTPFGEVARVMADHHVHAVAVADLGHGRPWGTWHVVSDIDLVAAVACGREPTAREAAGTTAATIAADDSLDQAARLMAEQGATHVVVLHEEGGYPVGILSTLDVVSACATADRQPKRELAR